MFVPIAAIVIAKQVISSAEGTSIRVELIQVNPNQLGNLIEVTEDWNNTEL